MTKFFVFGSNLAGRHGKGAARIARQEHGAEYGVGEGFTGRSYAIPTKDAALNTLPLSAIIQSIEMFVGYTHKYPEDMFKVTRIGCGLAGYEDKDIAPLFKGVNPDNTGFDTKWEPFLGGGFKYWGTYD